MSIPKTTKSWVLEGTGSFNNLVFKAADCVPQLSDHEVLVKFHAASLNFRDLIIPLGQYPFPVNDHVVPGSDAAGTIIATGSKVTRFRIDDHVVTLFAQTALAGDITPEAIASSLGGAIDGTLREYAVLNENGLSAMPSSLTFVQASTLPCAGLTAWNALYGLKPLKQGEWVLTQGTGGVSLFAIQFAKAAGAKVIATTSSAAKAEILKGLGADHVINYKEVANWGEEAKKLTVRGEGVEHSLEAVKMGGIISVIGFIAGAAEEQPGFLEALNRMCIVRGVFVGSRDQLVAMNLAIDASKIKPVVDKKLFKLEDLKEAYQYMWDQKHIGKLCIEIE